MTVVRVSSRPGRMIVLAQLVRGRTKIGNEALHIGRIAEQIITGYSQLM